MWVLFAFVSSVFLGFYDISKKKSLNDNAVLTVLFFNTVFCALIFIPVVYLSSVFPTVLRGTLFNASLCDYFTDIEQYKAHILVIIKSFIVLSSWILGYYSLKHLPITIAGPINALRPVVILLGAILLFDEKLNIIQWSGIIISILSLFLLSLSSKKEGIYFFNNKWIYILFGAVFMGAISGLYDKYIMNQLPPLFVQSWFNIYQVPIMGTVLLIMNRFTTSKFYWKWWIPFISIFISIADFAYFYSLSSEGALISVVSMIRRGSVIISFTAGAILFKEKNLKYKAVDLILIIIGLILLCWGSLI